MGFQTLAIEQRAVEVWRVLGATKTAFGKFGEVLNKVKHHIDMAGKTIDKTGARTRDIERKLRSVEKLPEPEALEILALPSAGEDEEGEDLAVGGTAAEPEQE
jgi:DNA recombination protein RmuC